MPHPQDPLPSGLPVAGRSGSAACAGRAACGVWRVLGVWRVWRAACGVWRVACGLCCAVLCCAVLCVACTPRYAWHGTHARTVPAHLCSFHPYLQPPFVRILRPRVKENTGFVLGGGGICMELLTPQARPVHVHVHVHVHGATMPKGWIPPTYYARTYPRTTSTCLRTDHAPQGWSPATSLNAVVMSVRSMLLCGVARLATTERAAGAHEHSYMHMHM